MADYPPMFHCKKWTIVALTSLTLLMRLIVVILVVVTADQIVNQIEKDAQQGPNHVSIDHKTAKITLITSVIVLSVISSIFTLVGLMGALKEHFCLSCTYAILCLLSVIGDIVSSVRFTYNWAGLVLSLITTLVAVLFVRDLHLIRRRGVVNSYA